MEGDEQCAFAQGYDVQEQKLTSAATRFRTAYLDTAISEARLPSYVTKTSTGLQCGSVLAGMLHSSQRLRLRIEPIHQLTVFGFFLNEPEF